MQVNSGLNRRLNMEHKLTADHFYKFFQCPHWIWYDIYGDPKYKKEMAPLLEIIYRGKIANAGEVLKSYKQFEEIKPELFRDLEEAFLATLERSEERRVGKECRSRW